MSDNQNFTKLKQTSNHVSMINLHKTDDDPSPDELLKQAELLVQKAQAIQAESAKADALQKQARRQELQKKLDQNNAVLADINRRLPYYTSGQKHDKLVEEKIDKELENQALDLEINGPKPMSPQPLQPAPETQSYSPLSSNLSMGIIALLSFFMLIVCYSVCSEFAKNPENTSIQGIINTAFPRVLTAVVITLVSSLFSILLIRLIFPEVYGLWNNKINTERNLKSLLNTAPEWSVLFFILGCFYLFMDMLSRAIALIFI